MSQQKLVFAGRRVDLVIVDAMFTLFIPTRKKTKWRMILEIYRDIGQISPEITDKQIRDKIIDVRNRITPLAKLVCRNVCEIWRIINTEVLMELGIPLTWAAPRARKINFFILAHLENYKVDPVMRKFLKGIRSANVRVVIGSNQRTKSLVRHLRHNDALDLVDAVYTSGDLQVYKPDVEFWSRILEMEMIAGFPVDPEHIVHIGNSANSDVGAAELGIRTLLLNRDGELDVFVTKEINGTRLPDHPDISHLMSLIHETKTIRITEPYRLSDLIKPVQIHVHARAQGAK